MSIILLILQLVEAIPTIITIIKEIMALIHKQPAGTQHELTEDFRHVLQMQVMSGCKEASCRKELEQFKQHLLEKYS